MMSQELQLKKLFTINRTGHYDRAVTQDGQGYLTNEQEAPNTNETIYK